VTSRTRALLARLRVAIGRVTTVGPAVTVRNTAVPHRTDTALQWSMPRVFATAVVALHLVADLVRVLLAEVVVAVIGVDERREVIQVCGPGVDCVQIDGFLGCIAEVPELLLVRWRLGSLGFADLHILDPIAVGSIFSERLTAVIAGVRVGCRGHDELTDSSLLPVHCSAALPAEAGAAVGSDVQITYDRLSASEFVP